MATQLRNRNTGFIRFISLSTYESLGSNHIKTLVISVKSITMTCFYNPYLLSANSLL